ncbi:hypothetical protein Csa_013702 [Cucumis sativus]|nr:hypothetical protein Csa_013702 [Cucumis sativus]
MKISRPVLLFFTILLFHLHLCFADDALDEFKACGVNYNCGELVNISYPFWGNDRQSFCGRREFGLSCKDNETTAIEINSRQYIVVNISQSDHRMTIARSELFNDYCPNNEIETATLDFSLFKYSSNDLNLSVWYDCPVLPGTQNLSFECGSEGEKSGRMNYALDNIEAVSLSPLSVGCRIKIEVMITSKLFKEGKRNRTMVVERGMKEGFEVEYGDFYTVACEGCKEYGGGVCSRNETEEFLCKCENGELHPFVCRPPPGKREELVKVIVATFLGTGGLIIFIIIIANYYTRKARSNDDKIEESIRRYSALLPQQYSYSKLKKITNSFKNELGQGGFSIVYRGKLPDGRDVAVKLLNESKENGQGFINEVVSITRTSHISDFGLAKQCKARESHVTMTGVKGTVGFIAPEVIFRNIGNVSHKSDVYSYGMVALEMVGARKNPNDGLGQNSEEFFPDWIYKTLTQSEIDDGCLWGNTEEEKEMTRKMIIVGLHCIQTLPNDRPSMTDVIAMLEGSVDGLQIPPKPNLFGPPTFEHPQPSSSSYSSREASQKQSYLPS